MGNALRSLFAAPEINPINHKAKSVPVLNPFDRYGRVFFFSWLGFLVAFLSWYAFPPLVSRNFAMLGLLQMTVLLKLLLVDRHYQK